MDTKKRVKSDCSNMPGSTCSVTIMGTEEEVVPLAAFHQVQAHGEKDVPELREQITKGLEDVKM